MINLSYPKTRRGFIQTVAVGGAAAITPRYLVAGGGRVVDPSPPVDDDRVKALANRAIDAARSSGATYADVRLLQTWRRGMVVSAVMDTESMVVGVRALVGGYWGFAAGPLWTESEMVRLSQSATAQARACTKGPERIVDFSADVGTGGHWTMPVAIDPFTVPPDEIQDYLESLSVFCRERAKELRLYTSGTSSGAYFTRQDRTFASTEGKYCTQRVYHSSGHVNFRVDDLQTSRMAATKLESLSGAGMGWEYFRDQPLREQILEKLNELRSDLNLPLQPPDVGRYDIAFDALGMARMVGSTLGAATELDRAMGFEANAGGTSYLSDPLTMLGTLKVGSPLLTVQANRSAPQQSATVRWDDEGVTPRDFTLVTNGILTDFSSTRESAGWVKESYQRLRTPTGSRGCALGGTDGRGGMYAPTVHVPNLAIQPGDGSVDFEDCVRSIKSGLAMHSASIFADFQLLNGFVAGKTYVVRNGKRIAIVPLGAVMFRTPELLNNITLLGNASSTKVFGLTSRKGEPPQTGNYSVAGVPAVIKQLTVIDPTRKA